MKMSTYAFFFGALLISSTAFSQLKQIDPNYPLSNSDMHCDIQNQQTFCDGKPSTAYNAGSCFERTALQGCLIINNGSTLVCNWINIFNNGVKVDTPEQLCSFQASWCQRQHYTDCETVYNTCLAANYQFKNVCMNLPMSTER